MDGLFLVMFLVVSSLIFAPFEVFLDLGWCILCALWPQFGCNVSRRLARRLF
jgi:hypothetical protein